MAAFVDRTTGTVCLGDPGPSITGVEFASGTVAILNGGNLSALWLMPEWL
jgi:hypothetical protein